MNLRFGIRDLLWAMIVLAMGLGWWGDRWQLCYRYDNFIRERYNYKHMSGPYPADFFLDPHDHIDSLEQALAQAERRLAECEERRGK